MAYCENFSTCLGCADSTLHPSGAGHATEAATKLTTAPVRAAALSPPNRHRHAASTSCTWCYNATTATGYCQSMFVDCVWPNANDALVPSECDDYSSLYMTALWIYVVASVIPFLILMACAIALVCSLPARRPTSRSLGGG